jgi:RHS repeat-associated protein
MIASRHKYPAQTSAHRKWRSVAKPRTGLCFTGKEKDAETNLDYFGARYLDKDFGLWLTPDAARQFSNLYGYSGNGYSPLNSIDPDGNQHIYPLRLSNTSVDLTPKAIASVQTYGAGLGLGVKTVFGGVGFKLGVPVYDGFDALNPNALPIGSVTEFKIGLNLPFFPKYGFEIGYEGFTSSSYKFPEDHPRHANIIELYQSTWGSSKVGLTKGSLQTDGATAAFDIFLGVGGAKIEAGTLKNAWEVDE